MAPNPTARLPVYARPFGVWAIVAAWGLAHLLLRAIGSPVVGTDDNYEMVLVQTLEPGYIVRQPPLYEWLLWCAQQVFGPSIQAALFVKYGLISLAALFLFLIARKAISDARLAALCAFSYSLYYQFGWNIHEGVTHTVVLTAACAATAYLFMKVLETGRLFHCALLGVAVGAGLLSKHSYPLFPLAIGFAALSIRSYRLNLRVWGLLLVPVVATAVYSPYAYWLLSNGIQFVGSMSNTMGVTAETSHLARSFEGLSKLAFSVLGFSVPLVPVLLLLFWQRYLGRRVPEQPHVNDAARLAVRTVLIMIAITAVLITISGATYVKERHMHPLLLLLPVFLFADLERFGFQKQWRRLGAVILAAVLVAFAARIPALLAPDRFWCGGKCRHMKPYADLKEPLGAMGLGDATIVSDNEYTGGNLRIIFPGARIMSRSASALTPPRETCFYVWEAGESEPPLSALEMFPSATYWNGSNARTASYHTGTWPHIWKPDGWRTTWWGVAELNTDDPICQ